jgi:probable F420-dependent oxidoreductase
MDGETLAINIGLSIRHALQAAPQELLRLARRADAAGLHSLWIPHHTLVPISYESKYPYQAGAKLPFPADTIYGDSLTVASFVAAATEDIRFVTNVIPLVAQHPLTLAKQAATTDHLSGGRLELGIGGGWLLEEGEILGQGTDSRGKRLDEAIELMRKVWTGKPVEHEGRFWQFPPIVQAPVPAQGADLPIWIGGGSPAAMRTVDAQGTGLTLPPGPAGVQLMRELGPTLAPGKRIALPIPVAPDADRGELLEHCQALREDGASLLVLYTDTEVDTAIAVVDMFAEHIMPSL